MRVPRLLPILLLAAFQGCDVSEAQRMDITRQQVRGVAPQIRGLTFMGRREVSIQSLLQMAPLVNMKDLWVVEVGDPGTDAWEDGVSVDWIVRGWWRDSMIFSCYLTNYSNHWVGNWDGRPPLLGDWIRFPRELRTEIELVRYSGPGPHISFPGKGLSLPFIQDFNELHWDTTFAHRTVHSGDTLHLKVGVDRGSPGRSDSMPVFANYSGLRTVGDYVRYLKPDDTSTLAWVVTAPAGDSLRLDLDWGSFGESHTFGFRVAR